MKPTEQRTSLEPAPRAIVVVEGVSDRVALEALAERRGRKLEDEGVSVVPIGGAQAIGRFLDGSTLTETASGWPASATPARSETSDAHSSGPDSAPTSRATTWSGSASTSATRDLEAELIRALGPDAVEAVLEAQGELGSFRTFQRQPAQRERPVDKQLRRFMGTRSGRKSQYARLLVDALDLTEVPRPLDLVLAHVTG